MCEINKLQYRLKLLDYINRMNDCRIPKQVLNYKPKERTDAGRPAEKHQSCLLYTSRCV